MEMDQHSALVWFRRDLRAEDQAALHHALTSSRQVFCVFVLDTDILDALPRSDRRVGFILQALQALDAELRALGAAQGRPGAGLIVLHGRPVELLPALAVRLGARTVFLNHDDEPQALTRDAAVGQALARVGCGLRSFKDHVVFERSELLTGGGRPYSVFTPYKNAWLRKLGEADLAARPSAGLGDRLAETPLAAGVPDLAQIGFQAGEPPAALGAGSAGAQALLTDFLQRIDHYGESRDFPALKGPSYLSTHLRFGTISIRRLAREAWARARAGSRGAEVWLSELIWRDFYHQIMHHQPHAMSSAFRPAYDAIEWEQGADAEALFAAWCDGRTGYPLVDAAQRQLLASGYMHNRLRMVSASFLVKHLGLDWRWGERFFAEQLLDFDLAANNGGWQWAASTGCDAQPWFRIFNPITQSQKFDGQGRFIRRYLPELAALPDKHIHAPWLAPEPVLRTAGVRLGENYPAPIVDHAQARARTLERFGRLKGD